MPWKSSHLFPTEKHHQSDLFVVQLHLGFLCVEKDLNLKLQTGTGFLFSQEFAAANPKILRGQLKKVKIDPKRRMHQVVLAATWIEDPKLNPKTRQRRYGAWILLYSLSFGGLGQLLVSEVSVQVIVACVAAAASTGIRWYLSPKGSAGRWTAHFSPRGRSGSMSTDSGNQKTYQPMDVDIYGAADTLLHLNQVVYRFLRWELVEWCKTTRLIIFWCILDFVCFYMFLIASTFVKRFMDSDAQALNTSPALSGVSHVQGIILHSRHAGSDAWRTSERRPEGILRWETRRS